MNEKEVLEYATFLILVIIVIVDTIYLHMLETKLNLYKRKDQSLYINLSNIIKNLTIELYTLNNNLNSLKKSILIFNNTTRKSEENIKKIFTSANKTISNYYKKENKILNITENLTNGLWYLELEINNLVTNLIILRLETFQIKKSISLISAWLKNSSTLTNKTIYNTNPKFFNLTKKCFSNNTFNFACLGYSLYESNIRYKNKSDLLETPLLFLKNGGNCLDFSFFFYSYLKYLKSIGITKIKLPFYKNNSKCVIYKNSNTYYYISNCSFTILNISKYKYFYVMCFLPKSKMVGHCIVDICDTPVFNLTTVFSNHCYLIEPQELGFIYNKSIKNGELVLSNKKTSFVIRSLDKIFNDNVLCLPYYENYTIVNGYKLPINLICYKLS